jgi:hypothetical protein
MATYDATAVEVTYITGVVIKYTDYRPLEVTSVYYENAMDGSEKRLKLNLPGEVKMINFKDVIGIKLSKVVRILP